MSVKKICTLRINVRTLEVEEGGQFREPLIEVEWMTQNSKKFVENYKKKQNSFMNFSFKRIYSVRQKTLYTKKKF